MPAGQLPQCPQMKSLAGSPHRSAPGLYFFPGASTPTIGAAGLAWRPMAFSTMLDRRAVVAGGRGGNAITLPRAAGRRRTGPSRTMASASSGGGGAGRRELHTMPSRTSVVSGNGAGTSPHRCKAHSRVGGDAQNASLPRTARPPPVRWQARFRGGARSRRCRCVSACRRMDSTIDMKPTWALSCGNTHIQPLGAAASVHHGDGAGGQQTLGKPQHVSQPRLGMVAFGVL